MGDMLLYKFLLPGERLDYVNDRLSLIQRPDGLCFGTDTLLLAAYIRAVKGDCLELGTGTGILSLLLATRGKCRHIDALEIQHEYAALAARNVCLNHLSDRIRVTEGDLRAEGVVARDGRYRLTVANPPYMRQKSGYLNSTAHKTDARHEQNGDIRDFCKAAAGALSFGGQFCCVFRPDRTADLVCAMRDTGLEPKRMTFVHRDAGAPPSLLLMESRAGGNPGLICTKPLFLKEGASDSEDLRYILESGNFPPSFY